MIAYASRTGTRRNLDALRRADWRLMVSARGVLRSEGFEYAIDNGAWTAFQEWLKGQRRTADPCLKSFIKAVDKLGANADFIIVPDIVEGGDRSWLLTRYWLRRLQRDRRLRRAKLLISVQDGFSVDMVAPFINPRVGVFVGGSTAWKLCTMGAWAALCRSKHAHCHVGRVNTAKRIHRCEAAGAHSFDGSSASRFECTLRPLELARQQIDLEGYIARLPVRA